MKKYFLFLCFISLLFISACSNEDIKEDDKKEINTSTEIKIATIGELNLPPDEKNGIEIVRFNWDTEPHKIKENIRFILISNEEEITDEKQLIIQELIKEKKVVFIFGRNQTPKEVKEKIGLDFEPIEIATDVTIDYPLYGFGYSHKAQKNIPFFFGSNIKSDTALLERTYQSLLKYHEEY